MTVQFERLAPVSEPSGQERRKVARAIVSASAILATAHGDRTPVMIGDVSTHGCNIRSDVAWLRTGRFVAMELGDDAPLQAVIRWVRNGAAGLEFLRPVSEDYHDWQALINQGWEG